MHPGYLIILLAIVLIIFGPGKLPDVGGAIGRGVREFQKTRDGLTDSVSQKPTPPAASVDEPARAEVGRPGS
jgi:sec-independent protein translocase protein TatA